MGRRRRFWLGAAIVALAVLVAAGAYFNRPSRPGCCGPEDLAWNPQPTRIVSEFHQQGANYTVTVVASEKRLEVTPTSRAWRVERQLDRIVVTCNGSSVADLTPQMRIESDLRAIAFRPGARKRGAPGDDCAESFNLGFADPQDVQEGRALTLEFKPGGEPVVTGHFGDEPVSPVRIHTEFALPWGVDVSLAEGRVKSVSIIGCKAPQRPIIVDQPAPDGMFGVWVSLEGPVIDCPDRFLLGLDSGRPEDAKGLLFEGGRLVKTGPPGAEIEAVGPKGPVHDWKIRWENARRALFD